MATSYDPNRQPNLAELTLAKLSAIPWGTDPMLIAFVDHADGDDPHLHPVIVTPLEKVDDVVEVTDVVLAAESPWHAIPAPPEQFIAVGVIYEEYAVTNRRPGEGPPPGDHPADELSRSLSVSIAGGGHANAVLLRDSNLIGEPVYHEQPLSPELWECLDRLTAFAVGLGVEGS